MRVNKNTKTHTVINHPTSPNSGAVFCYADFEVYLWDIVKMDKRYAHLIDKKYKEERSDFYVYFLAKMTPEQALAEEYAQYG